LGHLSIRPKNGGVTIWNEKRSSGNVDGASASPFLTVIGTTNATGKLTIGQMSPGRLPLDSTSR
jgi:hypothetical protein